MKKKIIPIVLSCITIIVAGCSSNMSMAKGSAPQAAPSQATSSDMAAYETKNTAAGYAEEEYYAPFGEMYGQEMPEAGIAGGGWSSSSTALRQELMFIKSANIALRSSDFDNDIMRIRNTVSSNGGYFESSNLYSSNSWQKSYKSYNATIRVPVENYELAKEALEGIGALYSSNESSKEVSGEYFNIQSRLETANSEEKRLLELIDEIKSKEKRE